MRYLWHRITTVIDLYRLGRNRDFRLGRWEAFWWALSIERSAEAYSRDMRAMEAKDNPNSGEPRGEA